MITDEIKKAAQNIGLDLTKNSSEDIVSGYLHLEKINLNNEQNNKFENFDKRNYIKTKFRKFIKSI